MFPFYFSSLMSKKLNLFTMVFIDKSMEKLYTEQRQIIGGHTLVMAVTVAVLTSVAQFCVLPRYAKCSLIAHDCV